MPPRQPSLIASGARGSDRPFRLARPGQEPERFQTLSGLAARLHEIARGEELELATGQASTGAPAERAVLIHARGSRALLAAALVAPHGKAELAAALADLTETLPYGAPAHA